MNSAGGTAAAQRGLAAPAPAHPLDARTGQVQGKEKGFYSHFVTVRWAET